MFRQLTAIACTVVSCYTKEWMNSIVTTRYCLRVSYWINSLVNEGLTKASFFVNSIISHFVMTARYRDGATTFAQLSIFLWIWLIWLDSNLVFLFCSRLQVWLVTAWSTSIYVVTFSGLELESSNQTQVPRLYKIHCIREICPEVSSSNKWLPSCCPIARHGIIQ